ncbi:Putative short-chain dehydrogenase/reductase SDR, NAD(P)-binding domain superfamily [Septoria linicola]|uniref:Short-chain dehydrogenase/reductase SDR, NAD(P)-binding domain superfamily n=1 Tax=Septoria linicola TaxID=215465 RepID=A0A9Q9AFG2_9PEZI|nr:Putative short-chain dehydrogenase/reductase SDR, NAD(P)-binding domain superfamily [Septoria linicola]
MQSRFDGKVCLITGAASGIGRATAIKMASQGAILALSDINQAGVHETKSLCSQPESHQADILDVSSSSAVEAYMKTVISNLSRLDFVFCCAGVNPTAYPLTSTTDDYWDKLVNTNLKGTYLISRAAIPHLEKSAQETQDSGAGSESTSIIPAIVNVSSIMGVTASPEYAIYCATKFGIVGFTKALALELGPKGIRVNAVAPGFIDTPSNAGVVAGPEAVQKQVDQVAMGRMGTSEEIADVVAFLFSGESRYMTGAVVQVDGGRM